MYTLKTALQNLKKHFSSYKTETLIFRPFAKSDCFPLFTATKNPEFNMHLAWKAPDTVEELMPEVLKLLREDMLNQSAVFSICEQDTGKWVGILKFSQYKDSLSYSLWIHPTYWRTLYIVRAAHASAIAFFEMTDLNHIYTLAKPENLITKKLLLNNYYNLIDRVDFPTSYGDTVICDVYKLNKEDWQCKTKTFVY